MPIGCYIDGRAADSGLSVEQKTVKVTRRGQVTLPKEYRDALSVEGGDLLFASLDRERIVFTKPGIPEPGKVVGRDAQERLMKELEKVRTEWQ